MAGRKVFTSGEILTSADVNSFLMDQSVMVFADSTARSSAIPTPSEGMVTYREDANRVEVYDGSAFGAIGGILQVVSATKTDTFSTTSTSFTDITDLSATITPSSATSKIFVFADLRAGLTITGSDSPQVRVVRDGSAVYVGDASGSRTQATSATFVESGSFRADVFGLFIGGNFLDTPATASPITYKLQLRTNAGTVFIGRTGLDSNGSVHARTPSSITLMEVAV